MKNGLNKHLSNGFLFVFICFNSLLIAKEEPTILSHYSNSVLELLHTPNTKLSEELLSSPTASLSYSVDGVTVSSVKEGDVVIVTATFSEAMADSPLVQISGSGVTNISSSNMTKVSTTSYTYSWTVGSGDGTQTFIFSTGTDLAGNLITTDPTSNGTLTIDNTVPTALINWNDVTTVNPGSVVTVYVEFSEEMANSPAPKISGTGTNTIAATDLVHDNQNTYTYIWTVGENLGTQTFSVSTGTDLSGNIAEETITSGASIFISNPPTASLVYTVAGNAVDFPVENDVVTITATFDHEINDSPTMQIEGSGAQILSGNMTKVTPTVYTYTYTVDIGKGVETFRLKDGEDLYGNLVTPDPSSGASFYHNPSVLNSSYEDFELNNPGAVKINAIIVTGDNTLSTVPLNDLGVQWNKEFLEGLTTKLNTAFNELYNSTNWPGFELARITKAYDPTHHGTVDPTAALSQIAAQSVAQENYINLLILDANRDSTNIAGQTFLNGNTRSPHGATMYIDNAEGDYVLTHEMGHVVGLPHFAGGWPPENINFDLQDGTTMGYHTLNHSQAATNFMGAWNSTMEEYLGDPSGAIEAGLETESLFLTNPLVTFKTPTFGAVSSEVFRSWLITNEYILASAADAGYGGHDTSLSVSSDWENEGGNVFSSFSNQTYPEIVTSQNETNNYAAVSFLDTENDQLNYSYRDNNSEWGAVTTIQGTDGEFQNYEMAMNSSGDVIIITETWNEGTIKVFSKAVDDASWTNSLVLSDPGTSKLRTSRVKVSINGAGNAVAVWLRRDNEDLSYDNNYSSIVFKERVAGIWSSATVLSLNNSKNELPSIAYNNNGDVLVSWQQWNASSSKYEVVGKFRNGATNVWTSSESYGETNSSSGFSQVAIDVNGNALVYWRQAGIPKEREIQAAVPQTGFLNVRYRNFDGTLEKTVQLTPTEEDAFNGATEQNENRVVFLEDGTAAVTWWVNDGTNPSTIYSSAMQSINVWTTPVALSNSGHNATLSKIATGNGGDYSVIWQRADGLNTRIQTRTYHAATSNWSAISTLSNSGSNALWGDIASDGDNQLSAIWVGNESGNYIPEVKRLSLNPFITKTTITGNNSAISVSFNDAVYNTDGAAGALETNNFTLSITGGTATLASTTPTSISSNENVYTLGVSFTGIPDGTESLTIVPVDSGVIFDSAGNAATTTQNNNSIALNDMATHTASLVYTVGGTIVRKVSENDLVTVTANFNQEIADSPIVQISGTGVNSISASNMTKVTSTSYTYSWTVGTGSGIQSFELETGTDLGGTVITATPSSGATIIVVNNIAPTAALSYTIAESSVSAAKENDVVTITALFSEAMADFPFVQISGSGVNSMSVTNMTKVSSTEYTYTWTAVAGDGTQNFTIESATDLGGNVITATPSSGASIIIDNSRPEFVLAYTIDGTTVSTAREGDIVTITATFNEVIADSPVPQISGGLQYESNTIPFSSMTKVSTTSYTYIWTVGSGDGNQIFSLGYGTDIVGNVIETSDMSGRSILVDNSRPTAKIQWDGVTTVSPGSVVTIYVEFSEEMVNSSVPQISGSGANTIAATDLVHDYQNKIYTYTWTVGENFGTQTFSVATGTDLAGNITEEILTSGGSILIDVLPTAALSYTIIGTTVSTVKQGDEVLITATFNKDMADNPVVQIYAEGLNSMSTTNMTKISSTSYTYTLTVGSGDGNQNFRMATGTDLAGNLIDEVPTSGETLIIDNTAPTITLLGNASVIVELETAYSDAGATASDNTDGTITNDITTENPVNINTVGTYTITYNVSDAAGNSATQVIRTVIITPDVTIPIITLLGDASVSLELGTAYLDAGATATDSIGGTITGNINTENPVNINIVGTYTITYNVNDAVGNAATQVTRTVNITADVTIPVISLQGDASISLELGTAYTDAGVTATDNTDGTITGNINTENPVNINAEGTYTITYNVSDAAGNTASQITRTVIITPDVTIPIITLLGNASVIVELGTAYSDAGATATDNTDGTITNYITTENPVIINTEGTYTITYNVNDSSGNVATQVTRTVIVTTDVTIPIITLLGNASVSVELETAYSDLGATASDNIDGTITDNITTVNPVDINTEGTYTITYNVSDAVGNAATQVTRTVIITPDVTIPIITLQGSASVSIELGTAYSDGGATATDNTDGTITNYITTVNPVDINTEGTYTITYNVSDTEGNAATQVTRTIIITPDVTIPIVTLLGNTSVTVEQGAAYTDAGATATDNADGTITDNITTVNPVDVNILGTYTITYNVSDTAENAATQVTRTVIITADVTIPIITLVGNASVSVELGDAYTDAGATATDNADGTITDNITTVNPVDVNILGTYTITYNVSDTEGNAATQVTRTVIITPDLTIPIITLLGDASISLLLGNTYIDAGATATDNTDGTITNHITTVNPVNINELGTYTITYNVSDATGNAATQVTRTVVVSGTDGYCDLSEDFENFPLTDWTIFNSNTVSNNITQSDSWTNDGFYSLRFSSKDEDSAYDQYLLSPEFAASDVERALSFFYASSEGPELFKVGWSTTGNNLNTDFIWSDEIIGIVEGSDGNEFNEYSKNDLPVGIKYIAIHYYSNHQNYLYIDRFCLISSNNEGGYNPGITLLGASTISLELGTTYTDAGAVAFDEDGINLTANIATVNPVDENLDGVYTITYNVSDEHGNPATEVTRTVTVFTNMWNGSVDNNWDTAANWNTNSVPSTTARALIPKIGITNFPTATTAVTINALTIESGASLIAASTFSGTLTYKRNLHLVNDWHFISSPVVGSIEDVISSTNLATGSGTNVGLAIYNNNTPGWEYYSSISSGTMNSGVGYGLLVNSGNVSFTGTMPIGTVNASTTDRANGWNLIGNPFPSYIAINNSADVANFLSTNSSKLSSSYVSIYLWDAISSDYIVINHASDSYDMSPGQGFFVNVNSDEGSVSFTEGMQSHQSSETFYRMESNIPTIELAAFNGTQIKSTLVKYFENTSSGLDMGYDAGLFTGGDDAFKLSTHLVTESEGIECALQALNINEFETSIIPVALTAIAGSEIVFSVEATSLPENMKVYLEDVHDSVVVRLDTLETSYTVIITDAINGIGRFYLRTTENLVLEGCTDSTALNFVVSATIDNGSCEYSISNPNQQTINLPMGWSLFSTYMQPEITAVDSVLQSLESDLIIVKDYLGNAYLVEWSFNNIGSIQPGQGYQVKTLQSCSFIVSGNYLVPSENQISLIEGWNLIGYLLLEPKDATQVFSNISQNVSVVKDYLGNAILPEWEFNAIGNMEPGKAYKVKMRQDAILEY